MPKKTRRRPTKKRPRRKRTRRKRTRKGVSMTEQNLILVTIDGVRWQEVFRGIDPVLVKNSKAQFGDSRAKRRALMPFIWKTVARKGVIIGNRDEGSYMSVSNPWHFSYPGYNEMITGVADPSIDSNDKIPNHNVSFIEWLQSQPDFTKNLAVFAKWDVCPYIFNRKRSGLHINAGFKQDTFTYQYAKAYLQKEKPRVMMIALGDSDDFAHDGNYGEYIKGIHRADKLLADLWTTLQSMPKYKNKTNLLITTDHGRGSTLMNWCHHSSQAKKYPQRINIAGSEHVWFAAIGPNISAKGLVKTSKDTKLTQVTATALQLLGKNPKVFNPDIAPAIKGI